MTRSLTYSLSPLHQHASAGPTLGLWDFGCPRGHGLGVTAPSRSPPACETLGALAQSLRSCRKVLLKERWLLSPAESPSSAPLQAVPEDSMAWPRHRPLRCDLTAPPTEL